MNTQHSSQTRKNNMTHVSRDNDSVIKDFGHQWSLYPENTGYYGSIESLVDVLSPLLTLEKLKGLSIADVGAGTGRYTRMLQQAGAERIVAFEPSSAFTLLKKNTSRLDRVDCIQASAEKISHEKCFDMVFCVGVLQFLVDPHSALTAMAKSLKPGGKLFLWVYSSENNKLYLSLLQPLRCITSFLSYSALDKICFVLEIGARIYMHSCRFLPLPLYEYMNNYYSKMDMKNRRLIIYDQLNPRYVKFYSKKELYNLIESCGFTHIQMHHRHKYSWSVLAQFDG